MIAPLPPDDDGDTWARIRTLARWLVIDKADLDDESDVWRCLVCHHTPANVAINICPAVIEQARLIQQEDWQC